MTAIAQTGSLQNIIKAAEAPSRCDLSSQGNSQTRPSKASASTTIKPFNSSKDAELTQLTADHLIDILSSRIQTTMNYKP